MGFQNFFELDAWKGARSFKLSVYGILAKFPEHERYELTSQLRRSGRSTPTNISEGHGRRTFKDQNSFCVIARGSHSETLNHLIDACDCGYISREELLRLKEQWDECGKVLNGYMSFLQSKIGIKGKSAGNLQDEQIPYFTKIDNDKLHEEFFLHLKAN
jgi:four helix bundle protein